MIKEDLARSMAKKFNLSIAESRRIIDYNFNEMRKELKRNKRVEFRGFGTWYTIKRNPQVYQGKDGKIMTIPSYRKAVFRQSKNFYK